MADNITETLFDHVDIKDSTPVHSEVLTIPWIIYSSFQIIVTKNGTLTEGVDISIEGSYDGKEFSPIDSVGSHGIISITDALNLIASADEFHVNFLRVTVTNKCSTPSTNYPTLTLVFMGRN